MKTLMEQFKEHIQKCSKCRHGNGNALDCNEGVRRAEELLKLGFKAVA